MRSNYAFKRGSTYFDFWLVTPELKPYLQPGQFANAKMIVIERGKASAIKIEDVRNILEIAENVEEFEEMVKVVIQNN